VRRHVVILYRRRSAKKLSTDTEIFFSLGGAADRVMFSRENLTEKRNRLNCTIMIIVKYFLNGDRCTKHQRKKILIHYSSFFFRKSLCT
jgi:hypothetical protein